MTTISKKPSKKSIDALLKNIKAKRNSIDTKKFSGKLQWKGDALKVQQAMRNE